MQKEFFFQKSGTTSHEFLAPCQNLEKTNDSIPRKCLDRRKDRRMDGSTNRRTSSPYFIGDEPNHYKDIKTQYKDAPNHSG